ncbi:rRNA maturation RNase YbeY [Gorillibacterium sp. sgz5001074]|uniref:rRNA maturation RNase YbeY n=1 Tax=Gorillibacterium sp. sgz5001074 TaxID=3446695 RepID=UPI003F66406C
MNLYLECVNDQEAYEIGEVLLGKLKQLLALAGEQEGVDSGELALSFVDDETIHQLNKEYRGMDKPTDVLSFAMTERGDDELEIHYGDMEVETVELEGLEGEELDEGTPVLAEPLGDIIISVPRAIAQAEDYGHSVEREIAFLFVHGFLHLIGYDHETEEDEKNMFAKQEQILSKAGITR